MPVIKFGCVQVVAHRGSLAQALHGAQHAGIPVPRSVMDGIALDVEELAIEVLAFPADFCPRQDVRKPAAVILGSS